MPVYFIGAFGKGSVTALEALQQAGASARGLTYLGRSGLETVHGLNVAFLDGTRSSLDYTQGLPPDGASACRHFTQVSLRHGPRLPHQYLTSRLLACPTDLLLLSMSKRI